MQLRVKVVYRPKGQVAFTRVSLKDSVYNLPGQFNLFIMLGT